MTVQKLSVGLLVFIAILYLMYVAIQFGKRHVLGAGGYVVYADFISAPGLRVGDPVEVVGVEIGTLESISLATDYQARVDLRIKTMSRFTEIDGQHFTDALKGKYLIAVLFH